MKKSRGNASQPRDAEGRFESKAQANNQSSNKSGSSKGGRGMSNERCRSDNGRFESCDK